ncbi:hypothetical protein ACA910_000940 [Epithemia clementina (nom. ined.)]
MNGIHSALWLAAQWNVPSPESTTVYRIQTFGQSLRLVEQITQPSAALQQGVSTWLLSSEETSSVAPSDADIQLLRQAFAEFYSDNRDLVKSEQLLSQVIQLWEKQPADEQAGLYRVRGDCYTAIGDARKAIADYDKAVKLLDGPGGDMADPSELPASLLGRARALKSLQQDMTSQDAKQAALDYERYLKLNSREEWETDQELLEDGATRNPYAAWEWGSVLRKSGSWKQAAFAHELASQAFTEIGDKARSAISLTDAGIDYAAAQDWKQAQQVLSTAIRITPGVESRDVALLQRVLAKEGEGRMALAALLWRTPDQRQEAETVLGYACERLEQLQADATNRGKQILAASSSPQGTPAVAENKRLLFGMDDETVPALEVSCFRFKNTAFLDQLGWPKDLQEKVIKLETLK